MPLAPRYLGLLGARHRSAILLQEASELCGLPLAQAAERTHAPIGIDLRGDGPEVIALAITTEVQHVLFSHGNAPLSRNLSLLEIHRLLAAGRLPAAMREECALYAQIPEADFSASPAEVVQ